MRKYSVAAIGASVAVFHCVPSDSIIRHDVDVPTRALSIIFPSTAAVVVDKRACHAAINKKHNSNMEFYFFFFFLIQFMYYNFVFGIRNLCDVGKIIGRSFLSNKCARVTYYATSTRIALRPLSWCYGVTYVALR